MDALCHHAAAGHRAVAVLLTESINQPHCSVNGQSAVGIHLAVPPNVVRVVGYRAGETVVAGGSAHNRPHSIGAEGWIVLHPERDDARHHR